MARGDERMVMLQGYGKIVDFFTSIPWWTLNPDDDLLKVREETPVKTALTYLLYCRDQSGQARLYVDGREVAHTPVAGDVGSGTAVHDTAERGEPLHLSIENPEAVQWLPKGGLAVTAETLIASPGPAWKRTGTIPGRGIGPRRNRPPAGPSGPLTRRTGYCS